MREEEIEAAWKRLKTAGYRSRSSTRPDANDAGTHTGDASQETTPTEITPTETTPTEATPTGPSPHPSGTQSWFRGIREYINRTWRNGIILAFGTRAEADTVAATMKGLLDQLSRMRVEIFDSYQVSAECFVPIVRVWGTGDAYGVPIFRDGHADQPVAMLRLADGTEIAINDLLPKS